MQLIERLAEKLESDPEVVEEWMSDFLDRLRQELDREGEVTIPNVGHFVRTDDGIDFTPDSVLEMAANHRYADLEPIEEERAQVDAPSGDEDRSAEGPPEDPIQEAVPSLDELEEFSEALREPEEQEQEDGGAQSDDDEQTAREESALDDSTEEEAFEESHPDEPDKSREQSETAPSGEPDSEPLVATEADTAETSVSDSGQSGSQEKDQVDRNRWQTMLKPVAWILIAVGAGALLYFGFLSRPSQTGQDQRAAISSESSEQKRETEIDTAGQTGTTSQGATQAQTGSTSQTQSWVQNPLRSGNPIDEDRGGYTWILASLQDQNRAKHMLQEYRAEGFRASVLSGGAGYRIAVGQFESKQDALAHQSELPNDVRDNAWILEISTN